MEQRVFNIFLNSMEADVRFQASSMVITEKQKEDPPVTIKRAMSRERIGLF
jgi:hypothetical protein